VAVTDDLISTDIKAGDIANAIAATTGGKGGGRPQFASAGIGDAAKLRDAREQTPRIVRELLER
jgi:alanyl-tRNA synthetase